MKIIYDIDCLLYFLKIKRTDLLEELFSHIVISNKVFNSLNNPSIPDFIKDKLNDLVDKEFVKVEEISYNTKTFDIYYEIKKGGLFYVRQGKSNFQRSATERGTYTWKLSRSDKKLA